MSERLNKYLAHAGVGSRRYCDDLIRAGRVKINDKKVRDLATQVDPENESVTVDGKPIRTERLVYWLVNKPRGVLCTNHDPAGRPRAIDLIPHVDQRVYTVGRLDEDSEGLLLMTNDGELAHRLTHPRFGVRKTYLVQVAGSPTRDEIQKLLDGIYLSDGRVRADSVVRVRGQGNSTWLRITLSEGKNREIRRMLARFDHKVMRLKRVAIGPIRLGHIGRGKSRELSPTEVEKLRAVSRGKEGEKGRKGEGEKETRRAGDVNPLISPKKENKRAGDVNPLISSKKKRKHHQEDVPSDRAQQRKGRRSRAGSKR